MVTEFKCSCGNHNPNYVYEYDGALGYEALVCTCCGRYYDFNGEHPSEEFSEQYINPLDIVTSRLEITNKLNELVGNKYNINSLNAELSILFNEEIKVEDISHEDDELGDYNLLFESKNELTHGFVDIYYLKLRAGEIRKNTIYITEVNLASE